MIVLSSVRATAAVVGTRTPDQMLTEMVRNVEAEGAVVVESSATRREESGDIDLHIRWSWEGEVLSNAALTAVGQAMWHTANTDADGILIEG
jgi:hypothetical protein